MKIIGNPVPLPQTYYAELLKKHGVGPASVDVTRGGQLQRFQVLLDAIGDTTNCRILDVGCGYGAFAEFLHDIGRNSVDYHGIDICPDMVSAALDRFEHLEPSERLEHLKFEIRNLLEAPIGHTYECVVASGLFQLHHGQWHAERLIKALWDHTEHVLAFNMLSRHAAPPHTNGELYVDPGRMVTYCQTLTPYVDMRHSYRKNDLTMVLTRGPDRQGASASFIEMMEAA